MFVWYIPLQKYSTKKAIKQMLILIFFSMLIWNFPMRERFPLESKLRTDKIKRDKMIKDSQKTTCIHALHNVHLPVAVEVEIVEGCLSVSLSVEAR